jgi:2'-5' RNA ligase
MFVAAWLGGDAREEAATVLERLRAEAPEAPVRWVPPENLHVTLRFLGDVEEDRADDFVRRLGPELSRVAPFEYRLEGLGAFPRRGAPRVVWAGLSQGGRELAAVASRVEQAALEAGVLDRAEDRPFHAHVTLGRPKGHRGLGRLRDLLGELSFRGQTHFLEEVTLAESRLTPRGAVYGAVARLPLGGAGAPRTKRHTEGEAS